MKKLTIAALMTLAFGVASAMAADDSGGGCPANVLHGSYGYAFKGTVTPWGPLVGQGTITFASGGNVSGAYFENVNGIVFQGKFTGTFTVSSDCTGTATMTGVLHTWTTHLHFVIVDSGKEILLV